MISVAGVGWPSTGSPPKQAAAGESAVASFWVSTVFQLPASEISFAWAGVSMDSSVSGSPLHGPPLEALPDGLAEVEPVDPAEGEALGDVVGRSFTPKSA